jgi:hypothetical protein
VGVLGRFGFGERSVGVLGRFVGRFPGFGERSVGVLGRFHAVWNWIRTHFEQNVSRLRGIIFAAIAAGSVGLQNIYGFGIGI